MIVGIDPGLDGALAFCGGGWAIEDIPTLKIGGTNKRQIDLHRLRTLIECGAPDHAFVEQVGAMPGQGVSSMFNFGRSFGAIQGVLVGMGIPMTLVTPQRWKRALDVPAGKDAARLRASQLIPAAASQWPLKKHDGRAEAALIALYGMRSLASVATTEEAAA